MTYNLEFKPKALKEWSKLGSTIKEQFKNKLKERLENPRVEKDKLSGYENVYKIKLRTVGYRLAYEVKDEEIIVLVLAVGKRENDKIYKNLKDRSWFYIFCWDRNISNCCKNCNSSLLKFRYFRKLK